MSRRITSSFSSALAGSVALLCVALLPALAVAQGARLEKLTVLSGGNVTNLAPAYLAQSLGYAREEGLDYSVKTVFANVLNLVVAGEGDLGVIGVSTALPPVREGKETSIVYAVSSGLSVSFLAASANVKAIADCTRLSTSRAGSTAFSSAMAFKTLAGAKFNILELGDANQVVPSVLSGGSNCAVSAFGVLRPGLENGLHLVVDPRNSATIPPNTVQGTISVGVWGMKDNLAKKRTAVEKLMRALKRVEQFVKSAPPAQVAAALTKHDDFKTYKVEDMASQVELEKTFWFPDSGYIRRDAWPANLRYFRYGLPFIDPANKLYSWESRVDMSYWIAANEKPARR